MKYSFFIFLLFFISCSNSGEKLNKEDENPADKKPLVFEKIAGTWLNEDAKTFERWSNQGKGVYHADVYKLNGADTIWTENARIFQENGYWIFENKVAGQNAGKAVSFRSTLLNDSSVTFSNPEHDFPTDINYTVINLIRLSAYIKGPGDSGQIVTIPYQYSRVN